MRNTFVFSALIVGICLTLLCSVSHANFVPIFEDNFDSELAGGQLNYNSFSKWSVTNGTVDLIGVGTSWDLQPGNGLYVDMDGSTGDAGKMLSSIAIPLIPGTYKISFDLAGNLRTSSSDRVTVHVGLGDLFDIEETLAWDQTFTSYSYVFDVLTGVDGQITFEGFGGDNQGALLDNVVLARYVPVPGALILGTMGLGLVGWVRKRLA